MDGPSTSSDVSDDNSWSLLSDAGRAELVVQGKPQTVEGLTEPSAAEGK